MEIPEMMKLRQPLSSDLSICFNICVKGTWARWVLAMFQVSPMLHYSFRNQSLKLYKGLWKCNKCKQLHMVSQPYSSTAMSLFKRQRERPTLQVQIYICPLILPLYYSSEIHSLGGWFYLSKTEKAVLPLFFFALCIAFMPLLTLNSRVAEQSLPLAFFPSSPWFLFYI